MAPLRDFNDLAAKLPAEARERARHRANQMRAEMLLAEIRKQQSLTQAEVAVALGIAEPSPAKADGADDMPLSTLRRLVASMGLQLDVAVVLADGRRVNLTQSQPNQATDA
jgi:DNA-binding XRE family transcriptional regulator